MPDFALSLPLVLAVKATAQTVPRPTRIDPSETDGELVKRVRRGDRWAEEALYHRHVRSVTRVVIRLLARTSEAEDVVQDAFVIALNGMSTLRDDEAFGDWLLSIAVRQVYRRFRRWRILRALGLDRGQDDATLAQQADHAASPETRAALGEIGRLLDTLPAEERVAWVLRRVEGERIDRVATSGGCSRATAKRRIARADALIRAHVALPPTEDDDD
ncbi:MAG TPA: RNA polymerase sigma factor [Polyangiaceae bacterium]|jgi:RNA polymerase sigma-70 factor (ECF subfamily)|nr:RNA polymerase sigma factor [Polyangiaceae bacterium]